MKKNFKRYLSMALALVMILALLPTVALAADPLRIEMEDGIIGGSADGSPNIPNSNASGGSGVGNVGNGGFVTHTIESEADYLATISIYYGTYSARPLTVTVNGTDYQIASCPGTGDWWTIGATPVTVQVELAKGENTIVFGGEAYGPNLDYFTVTFDEVIERAALTAENATAENVGDTVTVPVTLSNVIAAVGEGFNVAGIQFLVNCDAEGLELTGFEPAEAFDGFDWGISDDATFVMGFSDEIVDNALVGVALEDGLELGSLVFNTTASGTVNVQLAMEAICDNTAAEYTDVFTTSSFAVEIAAAPVEPIMLIVPEDAITLGAGATGTYIARAGGMTMTIEGDVTVEHNGKTYTAENGIVSVPVVQTSMWEPAQFVITNNADAEATYAVTFEYPLGTRDNPAQLEMGDNTATIAAGALDGYYYTWTAEEAGTLTLSMSTEGAGWLYVVNNLTTGSYGDTQWSDSDPVVNPAVVEVAAGDVLEIMVSTYDPADMWNTPAGDVIVNAAFNTCYIKDFSDVNLDAWYHEALDFVVANGIMKGNEDGTFAPDGALTRAQVAQILYNMMGTEIEGATEDFSDVAENQWFYDAIVWASNAGIVNGMGDGTFAPNAPIKRQDLVVMLYRAMGSEADVDLSSYPDADQIGSYAVDAMKWAISVGLVSGDENGMLTPLATATRAQAATILMRYLTK